MSRRTIDSSVRELALKQLAEGAKVKDVAATAGVTLVTIYNWRNAANKPVETPVEA